MRNATDPNVHNRDFFRQQIFKTYKEGFSSPNELWMGLARIKE